MRANGSGLSKSGDPLAAGVGDSGGVAAGDGVGGLRKNLASVSLIQWMLDRHCCP
jgi:hypothetical protein